jgi:hypothetical protein
MGFLKRCGQLGGRCCGFKNIFAEKCGGFLLETMPVYAKMDHNFVFREKTPIFPPKIGGNG